MIIGSGLALQLLDKFELAEDIQKVVDTKLVKLEDALSTFKKSQLDIHLLWEKTIESIFDKIVNQRLDIFSISNIISSYGLTKDHQLSFFHIYRSCFSFEYDDSLYNFNRTRFMYSISDRNNVVRVGIPLVEIRQENCLTLNTEMFDSIVSSGEILQTVQNSLLFLD